MADLKPQIDFASMSDVDIAQAGLTAAMSAFDDDVSRGYTNGDSLAIVVGVVDDGQWVELSRGLFGADAEAFLDNIDPVTGKLATTLNYSADSISAYLQLGDSIPEGPRRWTGAVYYVARVQTAQRWMHRAFVGAASGVQGHYDMATVYTALTRMGACWALQMQALHGKP